MSINLWPNRCKLPYRSLNIDTLVPYLVPCKTIFSVSCGERGIRTPGGVTLNSFQDCRIRPLCHFSLCGCKYRCVLYSFQIVLMFILLTLILFDVSSTNLQEVLF